jgi:alcohol dehydrogenase class IV
MGGVKSMESSIPAYKGYYDPCEDPGKVIFGQGRVDCLPDEVNRIGPRALLITSEGIKTKTKLVERVSELLGSSLVGVYAESAFHTPRNSILKAAAMARDLKPDVIRLVLWQDIVDDSGFDRAFKLYKKNWQEDGGNDPKRPLLPQIGLPTTLISAEHTQGVGITDEKTRSKQVFSHNDLRSQVIILDPELSATTPPKLWFSTGIKALEHAIAKLSALERHPVIDAISFQAVSILGHELDLCRKNPNDLGPRGNLLIGSWLCMFGSWESTHKRTGLSHAVGRQIGGVSGASHGMISAVMLPVCMKFNASVSMVGLEIAARALGVDTAGMKCEQAAYAAIDAIRALITELELPSRLRDIGVAEADLPLIAKNTMSDVATANNPRKVHGVDEILDQLKQSW